MSSFRGGAELEASQIFVYGVFFFFQEGNGPCFALPGNNITSTQPRTWASSEVLLKLSYRGWEIGTIAVHLTGESSPPSPKASSSGNNAISL